jgi:tetratricopeptide (TPR) repeat protein
MGFSMGWRGDRRGGLRRAAWLSCLLVAGTCLMVFAPARAADPREAFDAAARLYERGQYKEAAAAYDALLANGVRTPSVLFNQGNAWLKAGSIGRAIASYRQAWRLAPRDREIHKNLLLARTRVEGARWPAGGWIERTLAWLRPNEWGILAIAVCWLGGGLLVLGELWARARPHATRWAWPWALTALLTTAAAVVTGMSAQRPMAVMIVETSARYGPLTEAQSAFTLPDGAELLVTDEKDGWLEIRDSSGRSGWVAARDVVRIGGGTGVKSGLANPTRGD